MYDVKLIQKPSGRTHQVGGVFEPILDEQGNPETEYVLVALVDGHAVPLESYSTGMVAHQVGRADTAIETDSSSSSTETAAPAAPAAAPTEASPPAGEGTAGEGAAAEAAAATPPTPPAGG